jgi:azurin
MRKLTTIAARFGAALAGLFLLSGCPPAPEHPPEPVGEEFRIEITGDDRMQFDPTEFEVHPRQPVTITFRNIGTMPKESMGHNLVVLLADTDVMAFANEGARHVRNEFISPEMENQVIAATPVLGPGEVSEIRFVAPAEPGEYPFVCSFPGHTQAGMRGIMIVREQ